jgi:integrase
MWVVLYWEGGARKYHTLGIHSKMSKGDAQEKQAEFMKDVNARLANAPDPDISFGDFLEGVALPFYRLKWKRSTRSTTENHHASSGGFSRNQAAGDHAKSLQRFLNDKAGGLSRSMVAHLRWDLRAVFKLALAEGHTERDPTAALYVPKAAAVAPTRALTGKEVELYIKALELRESVITHIAIFAGMRPGEILSLQRRHLSSDCRKAVIEQRLYRGDIDTPKTKTSRRIAAIPPVTAGLLKRWMEFVGAKPEAWVFASENPKKPMWRDNIWYRYMKPRLEPLGFGWANFQALRRTHASLGHEAGIDPKVAADQRGHGIGVAIDVYTKAALAKRAEAAERLEKAVLTA